MRSPAEFVIDEIGGLTKTAKAIGKPITTVQGWKERGRVPQEHWMALIDVAKTDGKAISVEDFLREHPAAPAAESAA